MGTWETVPTSRTALVVLHNVTTLDRMVDVLEVFENDMRVHLLATSDLGDPFAETLPDQINRLGLPTVTWDQATRGRFDLVLSASHHGGLDELAGPLVILPHGAGFGKYAPAGGKSVFGMSPEWLLRDGVPYAKALGFATEAEISRLGGVVPEALPAAVLIGDPAFDRLLRIPSDDDGTVLVTSTWGPRSLLGVRPGLPRELLDAGLRVRLVLHPNVWAWHGSYQIRTWLASCLRDGLELVPPLGEWRNALATAGCVIGDHGSVTAYGAALGKPVLLGAFPDDEVVPGSPAHQVGLRATRLEDGVDLAVQVAKAEPIPGVESLISSVPGESITRLRAVCYRLMNLEENPC